MDTPVDRRLLLGAAGLAGVAALSRIARSGPLDPPPGPVGDSFTSLGYKTLQQVEPRTPINATTTPGTATVLYRIAQPGSYYLTENLAGVAGKSGIEIGASNVFIDLCGFTVSGVGVTGTRSGIRIATSQTNLCIINGCISDWPFFGVDFNSGVNARLSNLLVTNNASGGIRTGNGAIADRCAASGNSGTGLAFAQSSVAASCAAHDNTNIGISASTGSVIQMCAAGQNGASGIQTGDAAVITGCATYNNTGDGIRCASESRAAGNTCKQNVLAGIHLTGSANRVEDNVCTGNARGYDVDGTGNFLVRNLASGNGALGAGDYDIVNNNVYGEIWNATAAGIVLTSSPWGNFRV